MKKIILFFALIFAVSSCGTIKKIVKKKREKIEIDSSSAKAELSFFDIKKAIEKSKEEEIETFSDVIEYDGKTGDSLHIIKKDENGAIKSHTIVTGAGKLTRKNEKTKTSINTQENKDSVVNGVKMDFSKIEVNSKTDMTEINKMKEQALPKWFWLILIVVIWLIYEYICW